mgnify:CR=1 FL=1
MNFLKKVFKDSGSGKVDYYLTAESMSRIEANANLQGLSMVDIIRQSLRMGFMLYYGMQKGLEVRLLDHMGFKVGDINWFDGLSHEDITNSFPHYFPSFQNVAKEKPVNPPGVVFDICKIPVPEDLNELITQIASDLSLTPEQILDIFLNGFMYLLDLQDLGVTIVLVIDGEIGYLDLKTINKGGNIEG